MKVGKKNNLFLILSSLILLMSGCSTSQMPLGIILPQNPTKQKSPDETAAAKRFHKQSPQQGSTTVESAIELSKKYAILSEKMAVLEKKNHDLLTENRRLTTLEPQLQQTQKELTEANDLLVEMHIELNNWKVNVLGFRDEMRDAEKAQLEALLKVLNILGGEVKAKSDQNENAGLAVVSAGTSAQPRTVDN
jgi:small-conductance mechanosensitive channel